MLVSVMVDRPRRGSIRRAVTGSRAVVCVEARCDAGSSVESTCQIGVDRSHIESLAYPGWFHDHLEHAQTSIPGPVDHGRRSQWNPDASLCLLANDSAPGGAHDVFGPVGYTDSVSLQLVTIHFGPGLNRLARNRYFPDHNIDKSLPGSDNERN